MTTFLSKKERTAIVLLKLASVAALAGMSYVVISTSLKSNLFKEWDFLAGIPWMRATLWDFYTNALVIYLWICYKERGLAKRIIWLLLTFLLGSIASAGYWLIQLFRLKPGEGIRELVGGVHER